MDIINYTPFPAITLHGIDHRGAPYNMLVLRQTFTFVGGALAYAAVQAPLSETDQLFGASDSGAIRQESDLCSLKPKCDVIVNATAYAPQGKPVSDFDVLFAMNEPGSRAPLPPMPQGLNQFAPATPAELRRWEEARARAERTVIPGKLLINQSLTVHGERQFQKRSLLPRLAIWLLRWGTLTLLSVPSWKLTQGKPFTSLPLRDEYAYGGTCRINRGDKAAARVSVKNKLTAQQLAEFPQFGVAQSQRAVAFAAFDANLTGRGFATLWQLRATRTVAVAAPRIERPTSPVTAKQFLRWLPIDNNGGKDAPDREAQYDVASLCIRPKIHPERKRMLGTVDSTYVSGERDLPSDFQPAYWNAAPPGQQIDYPRGDETLDLTNLCPPVTPGATFDSAGNTVLRIYLPCQECVVTFRNVTGEHMDKAMRLDTIIVDVEEGVLSLIWRITLLDMPSLDLATCDLRWRALTPRSGTEKYPAGRTIQATTARATTDLA